jgi:acyl dehydratase
VSSALEDAWRFAFADIVRYCGASQDFNTIHHDEAAARAAGFDGVIAHGMLTLGRVLARVADEDGLAAISSATARFRAPVYPDAELRATGTAIDGGRRITVRDEAATVLTVDVAIGRPTAASTFAEPAGEPVADTRLRVERASITRLAQAVGARSAVHYDERAARAAGFPTVPAGATTAFVLPAVGWYPDDQDTGARAPDPVADARTWARSTGPVVHAGQAFSLQRPLMAGETVRLRHWITDRKTRVGRSGPLRLTEVTGLISAVDGEPIQASTMTLLATGAEP